MSHSIDTKNLSPEQLKALLSCIWDGEKFLYGPDAADFRIRRAQQQFKEVT
jgi:hypothetical protein